jgi:hypothetical protein
MTYRVYERKLDAPRGGAEDQLDGLDRTGRQASRVADAREGVEQLGLAVNHPQDLLLRARHDAGARADAAIEIDDRMDRVGHDLAERRHVFERRERHFLGLLEASRPDPVEQRSHRHGCEDQEEGLCGTNGSESLRHLSDSNMWHPDADTRAP